jgi:hypothetical protein
MQVQAAYLVRLGNALLHSLDFFVKAIYIDSAYRATEYTFYQTDSPDGHTQMVIVLFIAKRQHTDRYHRPTSSIPKQEFSI